MCRNISAVKDSKILHKEIPAVKLILVLCSSILCSAALANNSTYIHISNATDDVISFWINGEKYELQSDTSLAVPCHSDEIHSVQTSTDSYELECGSIKELH